LTARPSALAGAAVDRILDPARVELGDADVAEIENESAPKEAR
jgi:hypothetical protein